jgi:hypothetical protein
MACGKLTPMKLKLPRRRWLVLAGCLAVIGCGLVVREDLAESLQHIVKDYPNTPEAKEAAELLKDLNKTKP